MSFFGELGRRNVFRVSIAYAIVAWIVVQIADIVFETIGAPAWVMQTLMLGLVLGFVVALIFSWAYEVTPEGVKRESEIDRSQSITGVTGRKLDRVIMGLLVVALAYFVWESRLSDRPTAVQVADEPAEVIEETTTPISDLSIAVLPFENRSNRAEDEFFVEGMHDDLLTTLAKIGSMKVISRTSVMEYRDGSKKIPQIAEELGVANILEGGVQRSGTQVRINVQLIDADTDEHLWAEIYDRELTAENLFAIQSEISKAIAEALHATLSPEEEKRISTAPTDDLEAFDHYLRGRQLMATREIPKLEQATQAFLDAVELDPDFALAWVGVADSHNLLETYAAMPLRTFHEIRLNAIERALAIDSRLGEAYTSLGSIHADDNRLDESVAAYKRAIEYSPNYATAYHWLSNTIRHSVRDYSEAIVYGQRAAELDPRSGIILSNLAARILRSGDVRAALRQARRLEEMHPDFSHSYTAMADIKVFMGDIVGAVASYRKALEVDRGNLDATMDLAIAYTVIGAQDELTKILEEMRTIDSDLLRLVGLTVAAPFGADPRTREIIEEVLAGNPDIYVAWEAGQAALFADELDLALSALSQSFMGDLATIDFDVDFVAQHPELSCPTAWLLLESDGLEPQGQKLLSAAIDFYANGIPETVLLQDRWPSDLCHLLEGDTDAALDIIEKQLAENLTGNWRWDHSLPPYDAIRERPRYVAAWTEFERRMTEQREELRSKDDGKPAFAF